MHPSGEPLLIRLPDGRRLHARRRGASGPTVVFESGMGFSNATWGLAQPAIAEHASTVVYDRAGSGGSDDDAQPRTLDRIVDDLAALLAVLPGPLVLVGHSWGGPIVRSLAARGVAPVAGLVLVDPSDERAPEYFEPATERRMASTGGMVRLLARTGLYRMLARAGRSQPPEVYAELRRDFGRRGAAMMAAEVAEFLPGLRRLRDEPLDLGELPVTVITGTRAGALDRRQRTAINRAHLLTARSLPNGRLVEAERSGHNVMFEQPEIVVREVLALLRRI